MYYYKTTGCGHWLRSTYPQAVESWAITPLFFRSNIFIALYHRCIFIISIDKRLSEITVHVFIFLLYHFASLEDSISLKKRFNLPHSLLIQTSEYFLYLQCIHVFGCVFSLYNICFLHVACMCCQIGKLQCSELRGPL